MAGTTGYDALAEVNAVFVDPAGSEPAATQLYRELTGDTDSFADHVLAGKRFITSTILRAEVNRMARLVPGLANARMWRCANCSRHSRSPVYRSYLPLGREPARRGDRHRRRRACLNSPR